MADSDWGVLRIAGSLVILALSYLSIIAIYNLYLHPLSRYPGPRLWAISRLPFVLKMRKGLLVHAVREIHQKYGDVVRLAPNELSFINATACADIYGYRPFHKPFPKNPVWVPSNNTDRAPSILNANDEDHARIRRAWAHGFSEKALKDQEPLISSHIDTLIHQLHNEVDQKKGFATVDIVKWLNFTTFDIIGDLAFGESFGCLEENRYHTWVAMIVSHFKAAVLMAACRFYPLVYKLLMLSIPKKTIQKQKDHFNMVNEKVQRRLSLEKDRPDLLSHLKKHKQGLTDSEIESTAGIIIIAGSNSLATTLACTTNYLTRYPDALKKLTYEVRESFQQESDMSITKLTRLPYLSAVIEEGLRICSPIPLGMPRVVPPGGDTVCGIRLPAGTCVSYMQWGASRSSTHFAHPNDFRPERWLPSATSPSSPFANDNKEAHKPFSLGPRSCLGFKLAYFELRLILARLLLNFDISLPDGPDSGLKWDDQKTYAVWVREPFVVALKPVSRR